MSFIDFSYFVYKNLNTIMFILVPLLAFSIFASIYYSANKKANKKKDIALGAIIFVLIIACFSAIWIDARFEKIQTYQLAKEPLFKNLMSQYSTQEQQIFKNCENTFKEDSPLWKVDLCVKNHTIQEQVISNESKRLSSDKLEMLKSCIEKYDVNLFLYQDVVQKCVNYVHGSK